MILTNIFEGRSIGIENGDLHIKRDIKEAYGRMGDTNTERKAREKAV